MSYRSYKSCGIGNEKERNAKSIGHSSVEPVQGEKTKVKMHTYLSEEFEVNVVVQQESVSSTLLLAIVNDVATNKIKVGMSYDIVNADYILLIAWTILELQETYYCWKSALECTRLKDNPVEIKVMISKNRLITVLPLSMNDPCVAIVAEKQW